ncbi:MAG: enolase [Phycisphaerae bacterium]|nr:enolase [Phycisphaerae bacterium]
MKRANSTYVNILMKIIEAKIYLLNIPFKSSFSHSLKKRLYSDSIILRLKTDNGTIGFGEGIAREYITGEMIEKSVNHLTEKLLPSILNCYLGDNEDCNNYDSFFSYINNLIVDNNEDGIVAFSAARTALELALIDCILKEQNISLNNVLLPKKQTVTYSAVMTYADMEETAKLAEHIKKAGFNYVKIKVGQYDDIQRIRIIRDILGDSVSLRVDANGAFTVGQALEFINSVESFGIACVEQPIMRGNVKDLAMVKSQSSIPIMADESIITLDDAKHLIEHDACDYFNIRIAKCGGLYNTLKIADIAATAGIGMQIGCLVGETAILSAAGRHLAGYLGQVKFVEGSYSTHLLVEDISGEQIVFSAGGKAGILTGCGLGVDVMESQLVKYAKGIIEVVQ